MTYIIKYGIAFNFVRGKEVVEEKEAIKIVENAAHKVGIRAKNIGCGVHDDHLIPAAEFISQTHLRSEFTGAVIGQGVQIKKVAKKKA